MTTVLISGVPWHPVLPYAGVAVISDTRTSHVHPKRQDRIIAPPFRFTMKARPLGPFAIGAGTGDQQMIRRILEKYEGYFSRASKVMKEDAVVSRLASLYKKAVAEVRWERRHGKHPRKQAAEDIAQVMVAFVNSASLCKIWAFNDKGPDRAELGSGRGPYIHGSGVYRVTEGAPQKDVSDLWEKMRKHYERKKGPMSYDFGNVLYYDTHILAKAFYETYVESSPDQFTGDGVEILTLSAGAGIEEFELMPYDLAPGLQPGEGSWRRVTPPFLADAQPGAGPVRFRSTTFESIVSMHVDEEDQLSVLAKVKAERARMSAVVPRSQVPAEVVDLANKTFGVGRGSFFRVSK